MASKSGVAYPLKIQIGLMQADLHSTKDTVLGLESEEDLKIHYKIDNGQQTVNSQKVSNVLHPSWTEMFDLELQENKQNLFFQVMVRIRDDDKTDKPIDTFDITANIIEQQLRSNEELTDNITTAVGNHFTLNIKGIVEVNPKLQAYRSKIAKNEQLLVEVEPPYKAARSKFERFLNLKGVELLEEWGVCGNDFKLTKRPKTSIMHNDEGRNESEKIIELDMDIHDRSYLGASGRQKKRPTITKKSAELKAKHSFKKAELKHKYQPVATTATVSLEDIGDIHPHNDDDDDEEKKTSNKLSDSHEKVKKRIEKKHLYKPYKTSAIIDEHDELSISPDEKGIMSAEKLTPSQKIMKEENDYSPNLSNTQKLTSEALRTNQLGSKRTGLGSSLINFAMQDLTHTNKVKSVYNQNSAANPMGIGGMFKQMDISNTLSGMLMMNNSNMGGQNMNSGYDEDNCSLVSGNTFQTFQHFGGSLASLNRKPFGY